MELIGRPTNPDLKTGDRLLLAEGGTISLDRMQIRHVVFEGVQIHYSGEAFVLEDVTFINCQFIFADTPGGRTLSREILAKTMLTLDVLGS
jgi:hypothetical protein